MNSLRAALEGEAPYRTVREALGGAEEGVWVVGGALRDASLGRPVVDVDLAVTGSPEEIARRVARSAGGPFFPLSEAFGAWRAMDRARHWVCDVSSLGGQTIEEDLAKRDFSVNAMALPLGEGELVDPLGGLADLDRGVLRVLSKEAYAADPLRPLRLARLATQLELEPDSHTEELTRRAANRVTEASPERIFAELRRILIDPRVLNGLGMADRLGLTAAILPELHALHGVQQSHFHHLDVHDHTLEVLREWLELERDLERVFGTHAGRVRDVLDEPLANDLTRGQALRLGALLHDIGKPASRGQRPDGRVTFIGHDSIGAGMIGDLCRRLRTSERLREYLAGLARHHLVLGFMVHERPLERRTVYRYLTACQPVEVEVTALSCADRAATRGRGSDRGIAAHLDLAAELMRECLHWRAAGPPRPPLRGDELAGELGIAPGPQVGALLERLEEASFTGEVRTREDALALARRLRQDLAT